MLKQDMQEEINKLYQDKFELEDLNSDLHRRIHNLESALKSEIIERNKWVERYDKALAIIEGLTK